MLYRFLIWLKSIFNSSFICQTCGIKSEDYANAATIKLKYGNGAVQDLLICKSCADRLEGKKKK